MEIDNWIPAGKTIFAVVGGTIAHYLGGLDQLLQAFIVVAIIDYATGILKAVHNRQLSSQIGFKGIAKKVMCFAVVALAYLIESLTAHTIPLREMVILFFIANEGISILENAAQTGLPVPERLKAALLQLKGDSEQED